MTRPAAAKPAYLAGLIGSGIQASRTPALHEREGDEQGLRYLYKTIDLDRLGVGPEALPELLDAASRMGFAGLNITHPCKQLVIPLLDGLSDDARVLNAVNTVVLLRDGERIGHNTDWHGFAESFRRGLPGVALDRAVQLGAGGAGSAVAHALMTLGVGQLRVADVDAGRAQAVAGALSGRFGQGRAVAVTDLADAMADADGLVNTTLVGMAASIHSVPLAIVMSLLMWGLVYQGYNAVFPSFYPELFQTRTRVSAMAISQNVGTTITALLPALFAAVAPPGSANIPLTVGGIALGVTATSAVAAWSARETYRLRLDDLGHPGAVPVDKRDYDRLRARTIADAGLAR